MTSHSGSEEEGKVVHVGEGEGGEYEDEEDEEYEEEETHPDRESFDHDINFKPYLTRSISACEDRFDGIVKWPSLGGTYDDFVAAVQRLQTGNDLTSRLVTIGLKEDFRESSTSCCEREGFVTGLLHFVADEVFPIRAARNIWDKIVVLDHEGRKQGFYALTVHSHWLSIL